MSQKFSHSIQDSESLRAWLMMESNPYTQWILEKLQTPIKTHVPYKTESHHIIPKHMGGPNCDWNLILLTIEEHQNAHLLLYQTYSTKEDLCMLSFRYNLTEQANALKFELAHESQRRNKNGFFCSDQQKINGQKGGSVKSLAKRRTYRRKVCIEWEQLLETDHVWVYQPTGYVHKIAAKTHLLPQDVTSTLLEYKDFQYAAKPQSLTSNLTKVVQNKRKSANGWVLNK